MKLVQLLFCCIYLLSNYVSANDVPQHTGTLMVVNKRADTVSVIDLASRTIITTIATGKGPHELAMSPNGRWAVVTDYVGGNSLTVIDVSTLKVKHTIDLADYPKPHGIHFLKDPTLVIVSSEGSDSVVIADIMAGNVVSAIETKQKGSHMVAVSEDSPFAYTTNMGSNSVSRIDLTNHTWVDLLPMPRTPEAITLSKSGKQLWVGSNFDGYVSLFDADSGNLLQRFEGYQFPYRILLSDDERYAVVPDYRASTLDVFSLGDDIQRRVLNLDKDTGPKGLTWYSDDRTLFLSAYEQDKVMVMSISTGKILYEVPTGDGPDGIGYSPIVHKSN